MKDVVPDLNEPTESNEENEGKKNPQRSQPEGIREHFQGREGIAMTFCVRVCQEEWKWLKPNKLS